MKPAKQWVTEIGNRAARIELAIDPWAMSRKVRAIQADALKFAIGFVEASGSGVPARLKAIADDLDKSST